MKKVFYEQKTDPISFYMDSTLSDLPHLHKEMELIYVMEGYSLGYADRQSVELHKGDLFVSFPNQIHYYRTVTRGNYMIIIFSPDVLYNLKSVLYDNIPDKNIIRSADRLGLGELLEQACFSTGEYTDTLQAGILNQVFSKVLPMWKLKPRIKTENVTLQNVLGYCSMHFTSAITLEDVARELHISKYHISHLLNQKIGLSLNEYVNSLRVDYSCDLLEDTEKHIAEISEESGFGSIRSFNRAFSERMKMTPVEYRQQYISNMGK